MNFNHSACYFTTLTYYSSMVAKILILQKKPGTSMLVFHVISMRVTKALRHSLFLDYSLNSQKITLSSLTHFI